MQINKDKSAIVEYTKKYQRRLLLDDQQFQGYRIKTQYEYLGIWLEKKSWNMSI